MRNRCKNPTATERLQQQQYKNTDPFLTRIVIMWSLLRLSDAAANQTTENGEKTNLKQSLLPCCCITAEIHPVTTNEHACTRNCSGLETAPGTWLKINGLDGHCGNKTPKKKPLQPQEMVELRVLL